MYVYVLEEYGEAPDLFLNEWYGFLFVCLFVFMVLEVLLLLLVILKMFFRLLQETWTLEIFWWQVTVVFFSGRCVISLRSSKAQ
jgi:hypothetical protein